MTIKLKEGKVRIYKTADGIIVRTGAYVDEKTGNDLFADKKKVNWVECVEVDENLTTDVHLAQVDIKNGEIIKDINWEKTMMPPSIILSKHKKRISSEIEKELSKENPDSVKVSRLLMEDKKFDKFKRNKKFRENPPKEIYEIALKNLDDRKANGESDKPEIRKKIQNKIKELNDKRN